MKTIEEIKNEVAVKHGFENFEQVRTCMDVGTLTANTNEDILDEVATEYAKQMCDEPEWIAINSETDLPKDKNVFYFYAEGGKYYNTTPCNLMFLMSTYNFLKASDKPVSHYKIIQKPNTPNVVTTK